MLFIFLLSISNWAFSQDLEYFSDSNQKYGFKDKKGNVVIPATFDMVHYQSKAKVYTVEKDKKWGFISKQGHVVSPIKFSHIDIVNDAYFLTFVGEGSSYNNWNLNSNKKVV